MSPTIGIVLDYDVRKKAEGGYANYPWYALRYHYARAVKDFGGTPIMLPYEPELIDQYLEICHGLLIPGGDIDIPPSYYGEEVLVKNISLSTDTSRVDFELALIKQAIKLKIPILGICAGMQSLNVTQGGTLYQDLKEQLGSELDHRSSSHKIEVKIDSLLYKITGQKSYIVNTFHRQAVKTLGSGLVVSSTAPDGVIESIEYSANTFCIGVEWHPEFLDCKQDSMLFQNFVEAARQYKLSIKHS